MADVNINNNSFISVSKASFSLLSSFVYLLPHSIQELTILTGIRRWFDFYNQQKKKFARKLDIQSYHKGKGRICR